MVKKWTKVEENFLGKYLFEDPKETYLLFAEEFGLGRSIDSIRKKIGRMRETVQHSDLEDQIISPFSLLDPSIAKQQASLWLRAIASETEAQPYALTPGVKSNNKSLVIVISDVHWGKKAKTFNTEIANKRILSIPKRLASADLPSFDEIVVVLLGDLVEGECIFEHQANLLETPVITAHKEGTETLWKMLLSLKRTFAVPIRVETSSGNHGRMSKAADPKSNWDCAIYQSLEMISKYSGETDIAINVNLNKFSVIDIKGAKALINHKGIKHAATPAMVQKLAGWIISKDIDLIIQGHWHTYSVDKYIGRVRVCNGSACGPDDLGEEMAREDPACQAFFFVDPQRQGFVHGFDYIEWA